MRGDKINAEQAKDLLDFNQKMGNCMPSWMKEELEKKAKEVKHQSVIKDLSDKWLEEAKKYLDKAEFFKGLNNNYFEWYNDVARVYIKCAQELRYLSETKKI